MKERERAAAAKAYREDLMRCVPVSHRVNVCVCVALPNTPLPHTLAVVARCTRCRTVAVEREAQIRFKARRAEEAAVEEARAAAVTEDADAAVAARERGLLEARAAARAAYKTDLEAEMAARAAARARAEEAKYEERLAAQNEGVRRARAVADAKARKLTELHAAGVTDTAIAAAGIR